MNLHRLAGRMKRRAHLQTPAVLMVRAGVKLSLGAQMPFPGAESNFTPIVQVSKRAVFGAAVIRIAGDTVLSVQSIG
ncbi:MAG: hypothetical protein L6Q76_07975, partial [Polyangiaceae bacterium]|nr:hypothetical protein [Polyangiaceae bacterium]